MKKRGGLFKFKLCIEQIDLTLDYYMVHYLSLEVDRLEDAAGIWDLAIQATDMVNNQGGNIRFRRFQIRINEKEVTGFGIPSTEFLLLLLIMI